MNKIKNKINIDKFLKSGEDDNLKWEKSVTESQEAIAKLKPNTWNKELYSLRIEELPVTLFGEEALIIKFKPLEVEFGVNPIGHEEEWLPSHNQEIMYWIKIGEKRWHLSLAGSWEMAKINLETLETDLIKKTPEYKKATEDISKYANLEIAKIVSTLKEKYPEPIFADCITANTDPNYYY